MMAFVIAVHVIACALLIVLILIQRGHGGGLVESFSGVDTMFGPKTTAFLTRATSVLAIVFFVTCLTLAVLSAHRSRSLMHDLKTQPAAGPAAGQLPSGSAAGQLPSGPAAGQVPASTAPEQPAAPAQ